MIYLIMEMGGRSCARSWPPTTFAGDGLIVWRSFWSGGAGDRKVARAEEELATLGVSVYAVQVQRHDRSSCRPFAELGYLEREHIAYCSKCGGTRSGEA